MQTVAATVRLRDWLASTGGLAPELHVWHHPAAQSPSSLAVAILLLGAERFAGNERQLRQIFRDRHDVSEYKEDDEHDEVIIHSVAT
jgi:hypothetical protein